MLSPYYRSLSACLLIFGLVVQASELDAVNGIGDRLLRAYTVYDALPLTVAEAEAAGIVFHLDIRISSCLFG